MFLLELLGTLSLRDDARPVPVSAQQKRPLGLLGILALGGKRGLSRDRIETYLWPESASAPARHSLDQTVYAIRNALGSDCILATGRELRLNPDFIAVDVWTFEEAIRAGDGQKAVSCYHGPLLDGVHIADSRELESWIDAERLRLRTAYHTALELLASRASEAGDHAQSVTWWRKLVSSDPLSADATKKLMRALALAGDRAGAVKQARLYEQLVRQELEMEPDSEVESLAATISRDASAEIAIDASHSAGCTKLSSPCAGSHGRKTGANEAFANRGCFILVDSDRVARRCSYREDPAKAGSSCWCGSSHRSW